VVTAGTLSVDVGGQRIDAGPGQAVRIPRGAPHRWWNQGNQPLAFESRARPVVDLDRYVHAIFEVMNAGGRNRPPLFYLADAALRHRRTQVVLGMALPIQAILFRVLIVLGTMLGALSRNRMARLPGTVHWCAGSRQRGWLTTTLFLERRRPHSGTRCRALSWQVERTGIEPATPCLQSTNGALVIAPRR
jgi:cupin domain